MPVWKQHIFTAATIIFAVGVAWAALNSQVGNNAAVAQENKAKVEAVEKQLHKIENKQVEIDTKLENEIEKQTEFREDTKEDLRLILRKLDNVQGGNVR